MLKLVRVGLLLLLTELPHLVKAQFAKQYTAGSYVAASDSTRHIPGLLRLKTQRKLLVISPAGRKLHFTPAQVSSFQIGAHTYSVVRNVLVIQGSRTQDVKAAFAERLGSGRITLWRYTHLWNSGSDWLFLYRYPLSFYLVSGLGLPLQAVYDRGDAEAFQRQVRPLLQRRPDLLRLLNEGHIPYASLPAAIHALNTDASFIPPAAPNSE